MAKAKAYVLIPHSSKDDIQYEMRELVMCGDCKHNSPFGCDRIGVIVGDNEFCSCGKWKGEYYDDEDD